MEGINKTRKSYVSNDVHPDLILAIGSLRHTSPPDEHEHEPLCQEKYQNISMTCESVVAGQRMN